MTAGQPVAGVPVLMYHSVSPTTTAGFRRFTVTPQRFREHLQALRGDGWQLVTFAAAAALLRGGSPPTRAVAITVDDGLADFAQYALPLLSAEGAAATLFVPTAMVGATARWLPGEDARRPLLSWAGLADVVAAGVEIGSHGHRHLALDVATAEVVRDEVLRSRWLLQDRLGVVASTFAFPYGYQAFPARQATVAAGYVAACVVSDLRATPQDHRHALPRLTVLPSHDAAGLLRLVNHSYGRWQRRWRWGKQRAWRAGRLARALPARAASTRDADRL